jgi:hypothetical protein
VVVAAPAQVGPVRSLPSTVACAACRRLIVQTGPGRNCAARIPANGTDGSGTAAVAYCHAVPPLTRMFCAVTQAAASLARNATTAAISAGRPSLPKALMASRLARNCSLLPIR